MFLHFKSCFAITYSLSLNLLYTFIRFNTKYSNTQTTVSNFLKMDSKLLPSTRKQRYCKQIIILIILLIECLSQFFSPFDNWLKILRRCPAKFNLLLRFPLFLPPCCLSLSIVCDLSCVRSSSGGGNAPAKVSTREIFN